MDDWQHRVMNEKQELDERIEKLDVFIRQNPLFEQFSMRQRELLYQQLFTMEKYSIILGMRVSVC